MSKEKNLSKQNKNPPEKNQTEALLAYMARRAADRSFYLASALESFRQAEKLDESGLVELLEIEPGQLSRLALCGRPDETDKGSFIHDVNTIAAKFNLKPMLLAKLLRVAAVYETNRVTTSTSNNFLMAALDREDDKPATDLETETTNDD